MPLSNTANAASLLTTPLFFNRDYPYARNAWNLYDVWVLSFDSKFGFSEFGSGFLKFGLSKRYRVPYIWVGFNAVVGR